MTKVISFSSGKGGVGKTSMVANLGSLWARRGKRTLLVDGDWALGKLSIALGVRPKWAIERVLTGEITLMEAVEPVGDNLHLLASPSGIIGFEEMTEVDRNQLFFELDTLHNNFDIILLDHSSGVDWSVLHFAAAAHQHVVLTTDEPTSYADAYAIMKILCKRFGLREFLLVVTMSPKDGQTHKTIERFCNVVRDQLQVRLTVLDVFPWDSRLSDSIRLQKPFVDVYSTSDLTWKFEQLCNKLEETAFPINHGLSFFYEKQAKAIGF